MAKEAETKQKELEAAPGPWRSRRDKAGLSTTSKIQEIESIEQSEAKAKAPLLKKGFLNSTKGEIYPNGSDEGMLFNASNSGDPLGYIPKGLRSRVNVVDTATTSAEQQKQMMESYADGTQPKRAAPSPAAASSGGSSELQPAARGSNGSSGVAKGWLNGASLYPDGSSEGQRMSERDALRELVGDQIHGRGRWWQDKQQGTCDDRRAPEEDG